MSTITRASSIVVAGILGVILFVPASFAQNLNPASLSDIARQRSTDVQPQLEQQNLPLGVNVSDLAASSSGDLDLGLQLIMKRKQEEQPFRFFADVSGFYTNNAALTSAGTHGDSYLFADVGFTFNKQLTDELSLEATIRQGFFDYASYTSLNFDDFNIGTGLTYQSKKLWDLAFFGRYNFERFTTDDISTDFFRNNTLTVGVQKTWVFTGHQYFYLGYSSIFGWAAPTYAQRDEHGIFAGVHYNFTRKLYAEVYDRVAYFDYDTIGRSDLNQTVVATVGYIINDYAKLTASFSYVVDRSNQSFYNYDAATTGGGLALQIQF